MRDSRGTLAPRPAQRRTPAMGTGEHPPRGQSSAAGLGGFAHTFLSFAAARPVRFAVITAILLPHRIEGKFDLRYPGCPPPLTPIKSRRDRFGRLGAATPAFVPHPRKRLAHRTRSCLGAIGCTRVSNGWDGFQVQVLQSPAGVPPTRPLWIVRGTGFRFLTADGSELAL